MALSDSKAVEQIKGEIAAALPGDVIATLCRQLNHRWRERCMDLVTAIHAFLIPVLHGNTACDHIPHLMGKKFTGEADCMARS